MCLIDFFLSMQYENRKGDIHMLNINWHDIDFLIKILQLFNEMINIKYLPCH